MQLIKITIKSKRPYIKTLDGYVLNIGVVASTTNGGHSTNEIFRFEALVKTMVDEIFPLS